MSDGRGELLFADDHVEKTRRGEKETTMRTVKREHVHRPGDHVTVPGHGEFVLEITDMKVVRFGEDLLEAIDVPANKNDHIHLARNDPTLPRSLLASSVSWPTNWS